MPEIMSTPHNFSENGRRQVRSPEKSSFSHTCNLLSRYLKQKGSFGDLSLGMTCNPEGKEKSETFRPTTTMNLLPRIEISGDKSEMKENGSDRRVQSMDLFPQRNGFGPSEDSRNSVDTRYGTNHETIPASHSFALASKFRSGAQTPMLPAPVVPSESRPKAEPETSQLTIFYGGEVHVFDNFPAEKAREVMLLASSGIPQKPGNEGRNFLPNSANLASTSGGNPAQANALDLPIARKNSLHRFLEKRKERISSKAPYKLHKRESDDAATSKKSESSKSWLGLTSL